MKLLKDMKLAKKLPLIITLPTVLFVLLSGALQIWQLTKVLDQQNQETYTTLAEERAAALDNWLKTIEHDVVALSDNVSVSDAIRDFTAGWNSLGTVPSERLRALYISDNPHPAGKKDELADAGDGSDWSTVHARHHPGLQSFQHTHGYYDLFLFDTESNLVYSVFKEDDFGLNFQSGKYASSGLGEVFKGSIKLKPGEIYMTEIAPYAPSAGAPAMFLASPVFENGTRIGVVALQVPFDTISHILSDSALLGETGRVILTDGAGHILSQSEAEGGENTSEKPRITPQITAALAGESRYFPATQGASGHAVVAATSSFEPRPGDRWGIVMEVDAEEALSETRLLQLIATLGLAITALALSVTSWLVGKWVAKRFVLLSQDISDIAAENYDIEVQGTDSKDEIGQMAQTLEDLKTRLQEGAAAKEREAEAQKANARVVDLLSGALMSLSQGDFRNQITEFFPYEHKSLRYSINDAMAGLNKVINQVGGAAISIERGANEIGSAADELSSRTESQAATLEQTAAALEQITVSVQSASENVRTVEHAATDAKADAEESGQVVGETIKAMNEIEESSKQVVQIISVIDDIAFQTNLLALNAGVEAARAGEAGKGFAVVASEVRALAQRASDAALEIKTLIEASSRQVERGVDLVDRTGSALQTIVGRVTNISDLVSQIARSSEEQATALGEINTGVSQLDQVTQDNAAMVEETTAASHMLRSDSQELSKLMITFRTEGGPAALEQPEMQQIPDQPAWDSGEMPQPTLQEPLQANDKWQDF